MNSLSVDQIAQVSITTIIFLFFIISIIIFVLRPQVAKSFWNAGNSNRITSVLSIVFVLYTVFAIYKVQESKFEVYLQCISEQQYAPTTIICKAKSPSATNYVWKVNDRVIDSDSSGSMMVRAEVPGKYVIDLSAESKLFIFININNGDKKVIEIGKK